MKTVKLLNEILYWGRIHDKETDEVRLEHIIGRLERIVEQHNAELLEMRGEEFKTLSHCGMYVDVNLLEKGIYTCSKPYIYPKNETIKTIIQRASTMKDLTGEKFISESYLDNLRQCELTSIFIIK